MRLVDVLGLCKSGKKCDCKADEPTYTLSQYIGDSITDPEKKKEFVDLIGKAHNIYEHIEGGSGGYPIVGEMLERMISEYLKLIAEANAIMEQLAIDSFIGSGSKFFVNIKVDYTAGSCLWDSPANETVTLGPFKGGKPKKA